MVWLCSVVIMSNMVGMSNKWNDMMEFGGIVNSEQWLQLVMYEGRRTEEQKDIVVVVILSGVYLRRISTFCLHQEGLLGLGVDVG